MGKTAGEKSCVCEEILDPLACGNGETYYNQCEADCAEAKGCQGIPSKSHFCASCNGNKVLLSEHSGIGNGE